MVQRLHGLRQIHCRTGGPDAIRDAAEGKVIQPLLESVVRRGAEFCAEDIEVCNVERGERQGQRTGETRIVT